MQRISADIIHTNVGPPLENHCVVIDENGLVREVLQVDDVTIDRHLTGTLIPGFVNVHCHLELSHMQGMISPRNGLVEFVLEVLGKRNASQEIIQEAIRRADEEMQSNGIVAVGDISNGIDTIERKRKSKIHYHTFAEALGFREVDAEKVFNNITDVNNAYHQAGLSTSMVPHAPYSLSRNLLKLLSDWYKKNKVISSMHYFETIAEIEFCLYGTGEMNRVLEFLNYPLNEFLAYGEVGPSGVLNYLSDVRQLLLVHNTYANDMDLGIASSLFGDKLWLCTCPNANLYIEDELPEYNLWMENTNQICIGTDSYASNNQLSVWEEIKTIHKHFPQIGFEELLRWATINGAKALQLDKQFGNIEAGKKSGLIWLEHASHQPVWDAKLTKIEN